MGNGQADDKNWKYFITFVASISQVIPNSKQ